MTFLSAVAVVFAYTVPDCNNMSEKDKERGITFHQLLAWNPGLVKQWLDQLRHEKRFGFPEKLENVYVFKEHFNADCFETNSWVEIPEEGFEHTREKSSHSVMEEIPAYFTASSKLNTDNSD